jgi:hypothetical protein
MADQWYFAWNNHKFGPFSAAQLKELAAVGRIQATDTVWKEGIERGVMADKVKYLFPDRHTTLLPAKENGIADPLKEFIPAGLMQEGITPEEDPVSLTGPVPIESPAPEPVAQETSSALLPPSSPPPPPVRKARAVAVNGVILIGQDGINVQFKKKCAVCGCEDRCRNTLPIRNGTTRVSFFCPTCRKRREGEIRGSTN